MSPSEIPLAVKDLLSRYDELPQSPAPTLPSCADCRGEPASPLLATTSRHRRNPVLAVSRAEAARSGASCFCVGASRRPDWLFERGGEQIRAGVYICFQIPAVITTPASRVGIRSAGGAAPGGQHALAIAHKAVSGRRPDAGACRLYEGRLTVS